MITVCHSAFAISTRSQLTRSTASDNNQTA